MSCMFQCFLATNYLFPVFIASVSISVWSCLRGQRKRKKEERDREAAVMCLNRIVRVEFESWPVSANIERGQESERARAREREGPCKPSLSGLNNKGQLIELTGSKGRDEEEKLGRGIKCREVQIGRCPSVVLLETLSEKNSKEYSKKHRKRNWVRERESERK